MTTQSDTDPYRPSRRCSARTAAGTPCKAWAVRGTDPPRCAAHGGVEGPIGAPLGNTNALKHGFYRRPLRERPLRARTPGSLETIHEIIADLARKQRDLSAYIQGLMDDCDQPNMQAMVSLLALHGQNASRLGRLLRDQRALSGDAADGIAGAIAQALDELSNEMGVPL